MLSAGCKSNSVQLRLSCVGATFGYTVSSAVSLQCECVIPVVSAHRCLTPPLSYQWEPGSSCVRPVGDSFGEPFSSKRTVSHWTGEGGEGEGARPDAKLSLPSDAGDSSTLRSERVPNGVVGGSHVTVRRHIFTELMLMRLSMNRCAALPCGVDYRSHCAALR